MGIKAVYLLDFFTDDIAFIADRRFNLKVMVRVRLTVISYGKIGDKNEHLHFDNIAAKRVEKRSLRV